MTTVYLICGPTASGKTEYAMKLSKKINGEVISADSRQVYKGMTIGSGAPPVKGGKYKGIRHHLIGIIEPIKPYTAFDFQRDAYNLIKQIQKRGKTPIIVGGTGLWIRALKDGLDFQKTRPNLKLRKQLERELKEKGLEYLVQKLKKLHKKQTPKSPLERGTKGVCDSAFDYNNPRRVIRALEILTSKPNYPIAQLPSYIPFTFKFIHLSPSKEILYKRINQRVDDMIKVGLVNEVMWLLRRYKIGMPTHQRHPEFSSGSRQKQKNRKTLRHAQGNTSFSVNFLDSRSKSGMTKVWSINEHKLKKYPALTGIGYREIIDYLEGKIALQEAIDLIKLHTRQYAKRQITWFKKY